MKSILFALALLLPMMAMGQGRDSTQYHGLTEVQFEKLLDTVTEIVYIYRSYEWRENKFDGAFPMNPRWVHDMQPTLPGFISFMRKRVKE